MTKARKRISSPKDGTPQKDPAPAEEQRREHDEELLEQEPMAGKAAIERENTIEQDDGKETKIGPEEHAQDILDPKKPKRAKHESSKKTSSSKSAPDLADLSNIRNGSTDFSRIPPQEPEKETDFGFEKIAKPGAPGVEEIGKETRMVAPKTRSNKGLIAASAIGGAVVIAGIIFLLAPGIFGGIFPPRADGNDATVASPGEAPKMLLVVLQSDEDSSDPVAQYEANNTEPIQIASNAHVRFDSPDHRTAESMKAIARDMEGGTIQLLRKSYDVNNEFFINLGEGRYELQVQASWFEKGSFVYRFEIMVV